VLWWRASCSRRLEGHIEQFCRRFAVLETLRDDAEGKSLNASHGFITIPSVAQHTGEGWHFGDPSSVLFAFELDREGHAANVPSVRPSTKLPNPVSAS
jgi:hypothetical protein